MFDFLEGSLIVFPALALFAAIVAVVGHWFGNRGAISIEVLLLLVVMLSFMSLWHSEYEITQYATFALVAAGLSAVFIVLPMLILRDQQWLRGRVIVGLVGSLVAALAMPVVGLLASCTFLGDCL